MSTRQTTWRLGLDYDLAPATLLYGSVSTGYKAGGFNDGCLAGASQFGCLPGRDCGACGRAGLPAGNRALVRSRREDALLGQQGEPEPVGVQIRLQQPAAVQRRHRRRRAALCHQ
jgi:hypothetical protein